MAMTRVYEAFLLLYGPMWQRHASMSTNEFRALLNRFFTPHLSLLRLSKVNTRNTNFDKQWASNLQQ
jgi:hypothetical protein